MMNDYPRHKLRDIILRYGQSVCEDVPRCEGLMHDLCGQHKREISVLSAALRERVPTDLINSQSEPYALLTSRLARRLHDNLGIAQDASIWAVESWAQALGMTPDSVPPTQIGDVPPTQIGNPAPPPTVVNPYRREDVFQPPAQPSYPPPAQPQFTPPPQPGYQPANQDFRLPVDMQRSQMQNRYASFWQRFAAALLDGLILLIPSLIVAGVVSALNPNDGTLTPRARDSAIFWTNQIFGTLLGWLYYTLQESSAAQATLGKRAVGLRVVDQHGQRISFGRATGRYFGKSISTLLLFTGYLFVFFTERKQALHDLMAGTLVINK